MDNSRVLWADGLFLRPQVFQQQDRYHEGRLHAMAEAIHPYAWGVCVFSCDQSSLLNNRLCVIELSLVFQDGEIYNTLGGAELPGIVDLSTLPSDESTFTFYAALPARRNPAAKDKVQMLAASVAREAFVSIPVVRLRRRTGNGFQVVPAFLPPSVSIIAAGGLHAQLMQLIDTLQAKVEVLYGHHSEPNKNVIELRTGDISSFWMLHTISGAIAALRLLANHSRLHPVGLFAELLRLAGNLTTYSKNHTLISLPDYEHADPGPGFAQLNRIIRDLIDTVISSKYLAIALTRPKPSYHAGIFDSDKINQRSTLYLAVSADVPATDLIDTVALRFKVGSPDDVEQCVLAALPGVELIHMPQVPAALPMRPNTYYFALDCNDRRYANMMMARSISICAAEGFPNLKLDLVAIIE